MCALVGAGFAPLVALLFFALGLKVDITTAEHVIER